MIEASPDGIIWSDTTGKITFVNKKVLELTGFSKEDFVGKTIMDMKATTQESKKKIWEAHKKRLNGIDVQPFEVKILTNSGEIIPVELSTSSIREGDKLTSTLSILRDLRERKKIEANLIESEKRYKLLLNSISEGVYVLNRELQYILVNNEATRRAQLPEEKMLGRKITDLFPGHEKTVFFKVHKQVIENGKPTIASSEFTFPDGRKGWYEVHVFPVPEGILCISTDITMRKLAENVLLKSEERFRELADLLPSCLYELDLESNVTYVNRSGLELYGYTHEEFEKGLLNTSKMMIPEDYAKALKIKQRMLRGEEVAGIEYIGIKKDGTRFPVYVHSSLIIRDGKTVGLRGLAVDITERKKAEKALVTSNILLKKAQAIAHVGSWSWDIDTDKVTWSDELFRIHGLDKEKNVDTLTAKRIQQMTHPDDMDRVLQNEATARKEGKVYPIEYRIIKPDDNTERIIYGESETTYDLSTKKPIKIFGIVQDITERKLVEEKIGNLTKFPSENPNPVLRIRKDGFILYANASSEDWLKKWKNKIDQSISKQLITRVRNVLNSEKNITVEYKHKNRTFSFVFTPIIEENYVNIYGRDITDQKQFKKSLEDSEKRFREVADLLPSSIYELDLESNITYVNRSGLELFGYTLKDFNKGLNTANMMLPEDYDRAKKIKQRMLSGEKIKGIEYIGIKKDGTKFPIYVLSAVRRKNGKIVGIRGTAIDITERKQLEDNLKEHSQNLEQLVKKRTRELQVSEEILSQFMKSSPDGFIILDSELNYININDIGMNVFPEGTKKEDILGKNIEEIVPDIKETGRFFKYMEVLKTGKPFFVEDIILHPKFGDIHLTLRAFKVGNNLGIIYTDITEHKRMEQLLLKAKRLATIGETAGMVGHDLRNPLQAIVNTIYLANMKLETVPNAAEKGELKAYLNTVERQVGYMNKIVSDLLDYARPIHPELKEISMNQLIQDTLLSIEIPDAIEVAVSVPKKMKLKIDPSLMQRVLVNMVTNAVQAMPNGGKLKITVSKKMGETIIKVKDTGVGIRKEDLSKLFQPLFTTKSKGQGFGLPVCKRIVEALNGEIIVKSKLGKGSTFIVKIPLQD